MKLFDYDMVLNSSWLIPRLTDRTYLISTYKRFASLVFEKRFLRILKLVLEENNVIPNYQFGFREHHFTVNLFKQVHRVARKVRESLEKKNIVLQYSWMNKKHSTKFGMKGYYNKKNS